METSIDSLLERKIDEKMNKQLERFRASLEEDFARAVERAANPAPYMSRKEVCNFLGVSFPTVHSWMNTGRLPYVKIGRTTKFARTDVEKFIKSRKARRA